MTYGTFRPGPSDDAFPGPGMVARDFAEMARAGFNSVRVYTAPPQWLLDHALEAGLRVMVGLPWEQHVAFLADRRTRRGVEGRVRLGASRCAGHPALLAYAVGNEIPTGIVRWSGRRQVEAHLENLCDIVKQEDPGVAVTYVNYPSTEYLDLPFLDVVAFNVFLESTRELTSYIARLQNLAGDRPLLLTELGMDSRRNGVEAQARLVHDQIEASRAGGCAGRFVFAWTDEWHRGGWDVLDWDFGLTTRDREPKPALEAASRAMARPPLPARGEWPRISVVVCVHNGEAWLEDCLQGLGRLNYPDYEVVVVDDGSTDSTRDIVARHDVRVIHTKNRGLSRARNTGADAADGQIVAYIDADAWPDEDWLTHLALAFASSDFAAVGGPNICPADVGRVAACVDNAPGGPVHVLRTDREAEHLPGCNIAFRKSALKAVGGFDPRFRVAGDDVDVCWRVQEYRWRLGFAPAAVVWHHPRATVGGFWRQQRGYGAAEALLEAKWPEKYNAAGHVTWGGRVYGPPTVVFPGRGSRVYQGTWGEAPFQHLEPGHSSPLWETASMPEWYLALSVLTVLSVLGMWWSPLLAALPLVIVGAGMTGVRALRSGWRARYADGPVSGMERWRRMGLVVLLHLMQPAARLTGRLFTGLVPWRGRARARRFALPWERRLEMWREEGWPVARTLRRAERHLERGGSAVRRGSGYDAWDLRVEGGSLGFARVHSCLEEHGHGKQLFRATVKPRLSRLAWSGVVLTGSLMLWSSLDHAWMVTAVLATAVLLMVARALWECGSSVAALTDAILDAEAALAAARRAAPPAPAHRRASEAVPPVQSDLPPALARR
ncbi:MAG TPA: glycosyltransferase [Longimicrobiales bacterium]|nr:glycosyltransferase [Longimicrobiales bacterium]